MRGRFELSWVMGLGWGMLGGVGMRDGKVAVEIPPGGRI